MSVGSMRGLFVAEGSSDQPLSAIVEALFFERSISVRLSAPDYSLLGEKVRRDVRSKVEAGVILMGGEVDVVVVHRDSDNVSPDDRRTEILEAVNAAGVDSAVVPVIPVRMTEAWLLLDEGAIREVAGNPRGQHDIGLPKVGEVERKAEPKKILQECLLNAADVSGRRRDGVVRRFGQHRKQLLDRLDLSGPISELKSWGELIKCVDSIVERWAVGREN